MVTILVGGQWGDEGKGKIINVLFANRLDGNDPVPIKFRIR